MAGLRNIAGAAKGAGKINELRNRILFLLGALLVFRIGAHIPVPGIDPAAMASFFNEQRGTILGMFNMFSGGALSRLTVFALGIMPYISASIIFQLAGSVFPKLEELKKKASQVEEKSPNTRVMLRSVSLSCKDWVLLLLLKKCTLVMFQ